MRRVTNLLLTMSPDSLTFFMSAGGLIWGVWLTLPFPAFGASTSYSLMERIAPEWVWGAVVATGAALKLITLMWRVRLLTRALIQLGMFIVWTFVAASFVLSNWQSTATVIYPSFALASLWAASRRFADYLGVRADGG